MADGTGFDPAAHMLYRYVEERFHLGSLREVFSNYETGIVYHGYDLFPEDDGDCALLVRSAVALYMSKKYRTLEGGEG